MEQKEQEMYTKILGISFEGRQRNIPDLKVGMTGFLEREPDNKFDSNAVKFMMTINGVDKHLGYLAKMHAVDFAEAMDRGLEYSYTIRDITGTDAQNKGVNVSIARVN